MAHYYGNELLVEGTRTKEMEAAARNKKKQMDEVAKYVPRGKKVLNKQDGVLYASIKDAAHAADCHYVTMLNKLKKGDPVWEVA